MRAAPLALPALLALLGAALCCGRAQAAPSSGGSAAGEEGEGGARQVWFAARAERVVTPLVVCEVRPPLRAAARLDESRTLLRVSADAPAALPLWFSAPAPLTPTGDEPPPAPCTSRLEALLYLVRPGSALPSPAAAALHMESGALSVTLRAPQGAFEGARLALLDGGRVLHASSCEPADERERERACLLRLSAASVKALALQSFGRAARAEGARRGKRVEGRPLGAGPLRLLTLPLDLPLRRGDELMNLDELGGGLGGGLGGQAAREVELLTFELTGSLASSGRLDASQEPALLPLHAPEVVESADCGEARCVVTRRGVEVFALSPSAPTLKVGLRLKRGASRLGERGGAREEQVRLTVERCAARVPGVPLLGGVARHRMPIALARACFEGKPRRLKLTTWPPVEAYLEGELPSLDPRWRIFEAVFEGTPTSGRALEVSVVKRGPQPLLLANLDIPLAHSYRPRQVRLRIAGLGLVDFIPSNQEASLSVAFDEPSWSERLSIAAVEGFYDVLPAAGREALQEGVGVARVRAKQDARGQLTLRLSYTPPLKPPFSALPPAPLAQVSTEARYPLREVNLPLPLAASGAGGRVVEVWCLGGGGEQVEVLPGVVALIPFEARHGCRVVIHQARIPTWAGAQHVVVRAGKKLKFQRVLRVRHAPTPVTIAVPTDGLEEFERLAIHVGHDYASARYDFSPEQDLGEEGRYEVVLGDEQLGVSLSTSMPTGLFRFGVNDQERSSVSLSAGALARLLWLYKEGKPFPLGLDVGVFGTGLNSSPHLSFVGGVSLSVPVLNANTPFEASFNLHAWLEYSPTRVSTDESPWALLFGPSFAVGKFSTQL